LAEFEFAIGSDGDIGLHGFYLLMTHLSLPGIRSITRLAAAVVSQATPNTWKALRTLSVWAGSNGDEIGLWRQLQHSLDLFV
jgi:hypothetical protein